MSDPVRSRYEIQLRHPLQIKFCSLCGGMLEVRSVLPDNKPQKVCVECGFIYFYGPKLVAGCLVIEQGRVLLIRRGIEPEIGKWTFPGGYVDWGETPVEAALRETAKEVGMEVMIESHLGLYADRGHPQAAVAVYLARPGAQPPRTSEEALEARYFGPEELPWADIAFQTTRMALEEWLAQPRR